MKCHLAASVIRSLSGLGLYLTAHALTVHDVVSLQSVHVNAHDDDSLT